MGLIVSRLGNELSAQFMTTDMHLQFKDSLIDYYSVAQGAGVLQTIQAMQAANQPGGTIKTQGVPWYGMATSLYSISFPALGVSAIAMAITYIADFPAFYFAASLFLFVYFMTFIYLFKTKGLHQVAAQGWATIFPPAIFALVAAIIAYLVVSDAFGPKGNGPTAPPSRESSKDPGGGATDDKVPPLSNTGNTS